MTNAPLAPSFDITPVTIEDEMKRSYLDYAMSVIVSRALPDVRDGLKPVHRRILFAMNESGYDYNKPFRKSARIVGDVMGKYHPHGDSAIYDAMVRMAQDFSMRLPLIDGQGNFGSMDGDPAAAMRYTEARLARVAHFLIEDIDKETVAFQSNYDDSSREPTVLPARYPNLLVNGAGGIAVGMATNLPPHNLGEVLDACCAYLDNPEITTEQIMEMVPGPDFPTGGVILGRAGIRSAYTTGRGSVVMRGKVHFEEIRKDREAIIVTEVPYQVNKARMLEHIAELVRDKRIEGVSDLRDESDRDGVRMVIEIKRDAIIEVVLAQLYRYTPLQTSFGVNSLALNAGRPEMMPIKAIIAAFIAFREEVITKRTIYELGKARDRAHVLAGLAVAVANLDEVIAIIRMAPDPQSAREALTSRTWAVGDVAPLILLIDEPGRRAEDGQYQLSEVQAKAILDLRLHRLTGLERDKIGGELREIGAQIVEYLEILASRPKLLDVMRTEFLEIKELFATPRRTTIDDTEFEADIEDLIAREDMVVTVTNTGYIKRVPLSTYRAQKRGGKGRSGMNIKQEDFLSQVFVTSTHTPVLFFSTKGLAYKLKVYRLPLATPQGRGKALVNILPLDEGEAISTIMPLPEDESSWANLHVMFATAGGDVRRNLLSDFVDIRANGKIAMKLGDSDQLIAVQPCAETQDILLATRLGKAIRFPVDEVRVFKGRDSTGVRGIRLEAQDKVISMSVLHHVEFDSATRDAFLKGEMSGEDSERLAGLQEFILTMTETGYGKRTSAYEYRVTGRGGQGIGNIELSERNSAVVASFPVNDDDEIMLVSDGGTLIRMPVDDIRIAGRLTQGVTLFRTAQGEKVVSAARLCDIAGSDDDDDGAEDGVDAVEGQSEDTAGEV